MARWNTSRTNQRYRYVLCDMHSYHYELDNPDPNFSPEPFITERVEFGNVTGGSLEINRNTDTGGSCSFTFEGVTPPRMRDVVRIYYSFTDADGNEAEVLLGTFLVSYSEVTYKRTKDGGVMASGSVEGRGMAAVLCDRFEPSSRIIGNEYPYEFRYFVSGRGVPSDDATEARRTKLVTVDGGNTAYSQISDFCDSYGIPSPIPMRDGTVTFTERPTYNGGSAVAFGDSWNLVQAEVVMQTSASDCENVVRITFDDGVDSIGVWCANTDPTSVVGLDSNHWVEKTYSVDMDEAGSGKTDTLSNKVSDLKSKARTLLKQVSASSTVTTIKHPIIGNLWVRDSARVVMDGETVARGIVDSISIELDATCQCTTKIRQTVTTDDLQYTEGVSWSWRM